MKAIVVYYSFTGHTGKAARLLASLMDCDLEEIRPAVPYSGADGAIDELTKRQVAAKESPPICKLERSLRDYDVILLGAPVWWLDVPPAVRSFLSQNDLAQKQVYAFITDGGNPGGAADTLRALAPGLRGDRILYLDFDDAGLELENALERWVYQNFALTERENMKKRREP